MALVEQMLQFMLPYGLSIAIVVSGAFMRNCTSIAEYLQYYYYIWSDLQQQSNPGRQYQEGNMLQTGMISSYEVQLVAAIFMCK
ncbi:hypothetical protein E8E15_000984 [Penicillium rubens]|nr:hypothetical protein E8E15_000984 [Penicillium rubens]